MRRPRTRALCAGIAAAWVVCVLASAASAQQIVTTSDDDATNPPPGSLREAIDKAVPNSTITFSIEPPATINLDDDLGTLQDGLTIDGTDAPIPIVAGPGLLILDLDDLNAVNATVIDFNTGAGEIQLGDGDILTFTANNDFAVGADLFNTVSAVVGGSLVKDGAATLTLAGFSAFSDFSGDLTIEEGTVVGNTINLPEIITNDGALVFDQPADGFYFGVIDGTGSVEKTGDGALIFFDTHTYQGGTTISEGSLVGDATTLQGDIVNNADLVFDQILAAGSFAGNITGSGSLTKDGAGDLTLTGVNDWSGDTNVLAGRLIGTTSSISGRTVDLLVGTTELVFRQDGDGAFGGRITGIGAVVKDGAGSVQLTGNNDYTGGTFVLDGTLVVDTGSLPGDADVAMDTLLVFDQASAGTFGGVVSGQGAFEKRGGGTLTVTGAQTFTGGTTISGGALGLDGSLRGDVLVGSAGTFGGIGSAPGRTTVNGAVSPGLGGVGTFTVGNVSFGDGSSFVVDVRGDGTGDLLLTNRGVLFMDGSAIQVNPAPGVYDDVRIQVIQTSGSLILGTIPDPADRVFLTIGANQTFAPTGLEISVDGEVEDLEALGRTRNQKAVGAALDRFTGDPPELSDPGIDELFANMLPFETEAEVQAALDDLSGEAISAFTTARQALAERMQRTLHRRMRSVLFESKEAWPPARRGRSTTRRVGRRDVAATPLGERGMRGWLDGYAVIGDLDGDENEGDVDYDLYGASGGFDFLLGDQVLAGLAAGYARTDVDVDDRHSDGDADTAQGALYAAYANSLVYAGVSGRYAWSNADTTRDIDIGDLAAKARGDFDSHDFGVRGEVAVNAYETRGVRFQPLVAFDWSHLTRESFDESGAGSLGLDVDSEDLDSTLLQLGGRIDATFQISEEAVLAPELRAFWLHEFGDKDREVEAAIAGAPFTVVGAEVPRDSALFGVGWSMSLTANVRATADYDIRLDSDRTEHVGGVTFHVRF